MQLEDVKRARSRAGGILGEKGEVGSSEAAAAALRLAESVAKLTIIKTFKLTGRDVVELSAGR